MYIINNYNTSYWSSAIHFAGPDACIPGACRTFDHTRLVIKTCSGQPEAGYYYSKACFSPFSIRAAIFAALDLRVAGRAAVAT